MNNNLLTRLIDTENHMIYLIDQKTIFNYATLSKENNSFLTKHDLYKKLFTYINQRKILTPLYWASINGYIDIIQYLVSLNADIRANNNQAVQYASNKGHLNVVQYLK